MKYEINSNVNIQNNYTVLKSKLFKTNDKTSILYNKFE
jgi:hypothetical protein